MKECRGCHRVIPIDAFYRNSRMKDGHLNWCKECIVNRHRDGRRKRSAALRAYVQQIKMKRGCVDCGFRAHPAALDFDHLPGSAKNWQVGVLSCGSSLTTIHAEIDKCEVVCANCHRIRTAERRGDDYGV